MDKVTAAITAVGKYVPDYVLTNKELETMVETNDEWITSRTGIKERRILKEEGKGTSYLAIKSAEDLLAKNFISQSVYDVAVARFRKSQAAVTGSWSIRSRHLPANSPIASRKTTTPISQNFGIIFTRIPSSRWSNSRRLSAWLLNCVLPVLTSLRAWAAQASSQCLKTAMVLWS